MKLITILSLKSHYVLPNVSLAACRCYARMASTWLSVVSMLELRLPFGPTIETRLKNMKSKLYGLSENEKQNNKVHIQIYNHNKS